MKPRLFVAILVTSVIAGCRSIPALQPTPTALPGWRSPATMLLLDDSSFPDGWVRERESPDAADPMINHVYRQWWGQARGDGGVAQAIWRAYSIEESMDKYNDLRQQSVFLPDFTPSPSDFYVEFTPPPEISFRSDLADEFYLVCGWLYEAQCHVIARYRNYVSYLSVDLEARLQGHNTVGLTYAQIEVVVEAMDAKFAEAMEEFYPSVP